MSARTARYPLGTRVEESGGLLIIWRGERAPEVFRADNVVEHFSDGVDVVVKYKDDTDPELTQKMISEWKPSTEE